MQIGRDFSQPLTKKQIPPSFEMENALPKHFKALKNCLYYLIDFSEQQSCQETTEETS